MSLASQVSALATTIGTALKATRTLVNGNAADLTALTTTAKSNLVAAINELDADIAALGTPATINDAASTSTTQTWSIDRIKQADTDLKAEILGSAGTAYDTLEELKAYVDSGQAVDLTALGNRLRVDTNAQGLNSTQRQNGRDNIDVYSRAEVGDPTTDFAAAFNAALA